MVISPRPLKHLYQLVVEVSRWESYGVKQVVLYILTLQAATSHHLGQNFSKMFDIKFEDPDEVISVVTLCNYYIT